jgi:hypothetical protein
MSSGPESTKAAIAARRKQTRDKLARVEKTIGRLRRERGRLTVRAIAGRAEVSAAFLYENTDARTLAKSAVADSRPYSPAPGGTGGPASIPPSQRRDRIQATPGTAGRRSGASACTDGRRGGTLCARRSVQGDPT